MKNIHETTSSRGTILGNYRENYQIVCTVGAWSNPRHFVDQQPTLPSNITSSKFTTNVRTFLSERRSNNNHFNWVDDYSISYLTGANNKSIITQRFSNPGGFTVSSRGFQDFRSTEFSVYNQTNYRNLNLNKISQPSRGVFPQKTTEPSGSAPQGAPTAYRVSNLHLRDYGLQAMLSRHTAQFGRDSYPITDLSGASSGTGPSGKSTYSLNKNMFSAYAGEYKSAKSLRGYWRLRLDRSSAGWVPDENGYGPPMYGKQPTGSFRNRGTFGAASERPAWSTSLHPQQIQSGSYTFDGTDDGIGIGGNATWDKIIGNASPSKRKMTFAAWVYKTGDGGNNYGRILDFGNQDIALLSNSTEQLLFNVKWNGGAGAVQWTTDAAAFSLNTWAHIVVTYDANNVNNDPTFYVNGIEQASSLTSGTKTGLYYGILGGDGVIGDRASQGRSWAGQLADVAVWDSILTAAEAQAIYKLAQYCPDSYGVDNSEPGASYTQLPGFHKIHRNTLQRFELNAAGVPATASVHDNYFVQHQIPRSDKQYAWITGCIDTYTGSNDYPNPVRYSGYQKTGKNPLKPFYSSSRGYEDFFNFVSSSQVSGATIGESTLTIKQPISRLISLVKDPIWTTPKITGSIGDAGASTYITPYDHTQYGSVVNIMGFPRIYYGPYDSMAMEGIVSRSIGLYNNNDFATGSPHLSPDMAIDTLSTTGYRANIFNALMAKRENNYGWTWRASAMRRGKDHPILLREQKRNKISTITGSNLMLQQFDLPPVSTRGRPVKVNLETVYESQTGPGRIADVTLKVTHNNEQIFFPDPILNNYVGVDLSRITTPLENLISLSKVGTVNLNWMLYSENVFPSSKNSFTSASTQRIGYDNHFWRNGRNDRTSNLFSSYGSYQSFNSIPTYYAILSMWPLDAPQDFLTRTDVASSSIAHIGTYWNLRRNNTAGELQSTYYSYFTGGLSQLVGSGTIPAARYDNWINKGYVGGDNAPDKNYIFYIGDQLNMSALYARKHMNAARLSCVAPAQIVLEGTGNLAITSTGVVVSSRYYTDKDYNTFMSGGVYHPVETYSGEALWQAPSLAGTLNRTQSSTTSDLGGASSVVFQTQSSSPWGFNDYGEFAKDLNLMSRGYAIVPEFRISEHVEDYINYGAISDGKTNTFEIPGTGISSVTSSFYKDYSNSEFLTDFLNLREDSLLGAKEIRLVCSAAIRYNPYKGFYPAQRTLDLNGKFATAYNSYLNNSFVSASTAVIDSSVDLWSDGGNLAPLWRALFSPGLMYNTIKSGMAVDYPIVMDPTKIGRKQDFAGMDEACAVYPLNITTGTLEPEPYGYKGNEFFDKRLPFETLINPIEHLEGVTVLDMESHLSSALPYTASWTNAGADTGIYPLMASNFFGEVARFFLKDQNYTKLESNVVPTDLRFETGSVYGARIRMLGSSDGTRKYQNERDANGFAPFSTTAIAGKSASSRSFAVWGMRVFTASAPLTNVYQGGYPKTSRGSDVYITIPQDPKNCAGKSEFQRNFIMYSRPTAFGPPIAGRSYSYPGLALTASQKGVMDSFEGYNWAYTPPYTNGECWADLIFWPKGDKAYDLEQILAETHIVYRRVDPGALTGSASDGSDAATTLMLGGPGSTLLEENPIYSGPNINSNAMQLSASLNLLGIENIYKTTEDRFGETSSTTNEVIGKKWIIQPKFETPMMNFSDESGGTAVGGARMTRPISVSSSTLTLPIYGSASVPRGMWHQFGTLPERPDHGIFMDIGAIPEQWLKHHYEILNTGSIYNNYDLSDTRRTVWKKMKSLAELGGFQKTGQQKRLGELKEKTVIKEAIVAVPYIVEESDFAITSQTYSPVRTTSKKFIDIPKRRFEAATSRIGSREGDSLGTAGESIRKLVQKIPKYVLPPQLDFVSNPNIDPIVMYIFEFEYKLDRDDLSYIWQNLAPRDSRKITFQHSSIAHELMDTELLNEKALLANQQLRWMVFKVKQRATGEYYSLVADQAAQASSGIPTGPRHAGTPPGYKIQYNWPYDYLSFVELIKMDVDVLYRAESVTASPESTVGADAATAQEDLVAKKKAAIEKVKGAASAAKAKTGAGVVKTTSTSQGGTSANPPTTTGTTQGTGQGGGGQGGGGQGGGGQGGGGQGGGGNY